MHTQSFGALNSIGSAGSIGSNRRQFLAGAALLLGASTFLAACGDDDVAAAFLDLPLKDVAAVISANHGHKGLLTKAQLEAGKTITISITGAASHAHQVTITAAQMDLLKQGKKVALTSTAGGGHKHQVSFQLTAV